MVSQLRTSNEIFKEHYRCSIESTNRKSFNQRVGVVVVGALTHNTVGPDTVSEEKVVAIYLTEKMAEELINTSVERIREQEQRNIDPQLYRLYMEYKLWLELKR